MSRGLRSPHARHYHSPTPWSSLPPAPLDPSTLPRTRLHSLGESVRNNLPSLDRHSLASAASSSTTPSFRHSRAVHSWLKRVAPHFGLACHRFLPHSPSLRLTVSPSVCHHTPYKEGGCRRPQGVSTVSGLYATYYLSPVLVTPIMARRVSSLFRRFVLHGCLSL
jgi:hypothetical protein